MSADAEPEETYGEMGEAMRALPNDKWRAFVRHYCTDVEFGNGSRAYRAAGFAGNDNTVKTQAYRMLHDQRVIAAIGEESRKIFRAGAPEAVQAALNIVRNPDHKDHGRLLAALIERVDPLTTQHRIDVMHKTIDPTEEMLENLAAVRRLGVTREKMIELFGWNGLERLEKLEARRNAANADAAKLIEGTTNE